MAPSVHVRDPGKHRQIFEVDAMTLADEALGRCDGLSDEEIRRQIDDALEARSTAFFVVMWR